MTGDKRIQNSPWQERIAVLLLLFALIAVPAVALEGTDLPLNTAKPTAGVLDEIPPGADTENNATPEPTPTETVEDEVTPAAARQLLQYAGTDADISDLGASMVIPSNNDVLLRISNDGNARFNDYGNNTYHFFSPGQSGTQGMNALHITIDPAESSGQVTVSSDQSGVFYITDTGGRGWDDNGILMLAVNGTIPDSFRVNIKASGYQWTPVLTGTYPTFDNVTYVPEALNETFTKDDFLYGPQIWRPCAATNYPIFDGQDMTDTANTFSLLFIDLNAGILGAGTLNQPSFSGQSVTDNGALKVEYSFENLPTLAAFDAYVYTVSSNQGQGIRWTNRLSASGSSGYAVIGQPLPEVPTADFTANVTSGDAPLAVLFTDASTGSPTSWVWDFGDNTTSTDQNAIHTYMAAGTYSVNLTVKNTAGSDSEVKEDLVTVGETPSGIGLADTAWPKFGYDLQNTGRSPNLGPQTGTVKWTYTIADATKGQPVIGSDGTVYVACYNKDLYAFNPDGTLKWTYTTGNRLHGSPAIGADGTIYVGCADYKIYAINPDGTLKWTCTTDSAIFTSSPTIGPDGTIYIGTSGYQKGNNLHAISDDGTQGTIKWTYGTGEAYNTPAVGTDGTIYIGSLDNNLYAIHPDGTLKWVYTTGGKMQRTSPSIGPDGTIYIGNNDKNLYAVNQNGTLKWTYTFGSYIYSSVAIGSDGTIYTGNNDKKVYAINPDGTLKWDFTTGNTIRATPVIGSDGTIYVGSYDKKMYALNPDGTLKWTYQIGGVIEGHASIGSDGTLYVGGGNRIVYAFKDATTPPTADFTANATAGDAPLAVLFTDTSTGTVTSWAWDFENDGVVDSTTRNATHIYTTAGNYTVNLTVANPVGGDFEVKTGYITVSESSGSSVANITVSPNSLFLTAGDGQQFTATAYDNDSAEVPDAVFNWTSSDETVGTVNKTGYFSALKAGNTTVGATTGGVSGIAHVTVLRGETPTGGVITATDDVYLTVANDEGAYFNDFGDNSFHIIWTGGGLNSLHISNGTPSYGGLFYGEVTTTSDQSGTFNVTTTGGRGYQDDIFLCVAINGTISDDFRLHLVAEGCQWTPNPTPHSAPASDAITHNATTLDEWFTKGDLVYGPQTWRPAAKTTYPLYLGQNVSDTSDQFMLMFVDLNGGVLTEHPLRVSYEFQNLNTSACFNVYGYAQNADSVNDCVNSWTNCLTGSGDENSGWYVYGVPLEPSARVNITPSDVEVPVNGKKIFTATAYDIYDKEISGALFHWTSSNETVGTVNETGVFTARKVGTSTVTAACGNVTGTAVVTVTQPQGDQTQDTPLDIPGCNVTTGNDGKPQVSINTTATNATINGNTIRIDEGNFTLTIETEGAPTNESGIVNGTIANITLDTQPVTTELGSVGTVSASVSANLNGIPQGAGLTTTVSQNVSADAQSAFQLAATADGLALGDVAYTLNIVRTNLENGQDIAGATIRMAVSPAWVAAHGGVDAIRIIRSAEDGTNEVLATTLVGTDADGNMVFEAVSPNGLSIFGLAAATAASQPTGSSSSSGGSSGTSTSVGAASNLKSGESVTLAMDATAVSAVTLTANAEVRDLMMTVAKGSLPQAAEPPAGTVYQYVQATLYKATEADLAAVQLRFAVPSKWLSENDCTAEQVTLFRYADGAWQAVPVEALGEENGNPVFSAAANGFGLFAIAATEEVPGPTGEATGEPTTTETPTGTSGTVAHAEEGQATPQATPFPVWAAILAFGVLLFVRRT